jgi:transcriptional regulator with XRE-family HTH domain
MTDNTFLSAMGKRIRRQRLTKRLTQAQVGIAVGISRVQISSIESGICGTTPETIYSLSVVFNCSVADLFPEHSQYKPKLKLAPPAKQGARTRLRQLKLDLNNTIKHTASEKNK